VCTGILPVGAQGAILHQQAQAFLATGASYEVSEDIVRSSEPGRLLRSRVRLVNGAQAVRSHTDYLLHWTIDHPELDVQVAQVMWPDADNLLPTELGYNPEYIQPLLAVAVGTTYDDLLLGSESQGRVLAQAALVKPLAAAVADRYSEVGDDWALYATIEGLQPLLGSGVDYIQNVKQVLSYAFAENLQNAESAVQIMDPDHWTAGALFTALFRVSNPKAVTDEVVDHDGVDEDEDEEVPLIPPVEYLTHSQVGMEGVWIKTEVHDSGLNLLTLSAAGFIQTDADYLLCHEDGMLQLLRVDYAAQLDDTVRTRAVHQAMLAYSQLHESELYLLGEITLGMDCIGNTMTLLANHVDYPVPVMLLTATFEADESYEVEMHGAVAELQLHDRLHDELLDSLWTYYKDPAAVVCVANPVHVKI